MNYTAGYQHIQNKIRNDQCVILDGAIATELQRSGARSFELSDDTHWGFDALQTSPDIVRDIHLRYLDAGADILTTNTYSILEAPTYTSDRDLHVEKPIHWMDLARAALELPREAIARKNRQSTVAVAFSIGGEIENDQQRITVELLLGKVFRDCPPDLVLFESLYLIDDNQTLDVIGMLIDEGIPVWASFRRCRKGVCGIHGQLWGGPEGDRFGRLAQTLETKGVESLLINCMPINRIEGTLPWLRDYTDLPLGVYPNLGRFVEGQWLFDDRMPAGKFSEFALQWRDEGAQIIGGCCGTGPDDISDVARTLSKTSAGTRRNEFLASDASITGQTKTGSVNTQAFWQDNIGRNLFPLPVPQITADPGVFVPTQGSYLIWKYLFANKIGENQNCLDVGCGVGILAIQLALNGANHVTAFDIQKEAVNNTLTNAFRNGVTDRVSGIAADLYAFLPEERFDVIAASLYQMPTDPKRNMRGHRDIDYWGRNLLDHFIRNLQDYLAEGGTAYLMQVSMLGAKRTSDLLVRYGLEAKVVDFNLYKFNPVFKENLEQIEKVEKLSDAYHFSFGHDEHTMVMYLLKITRQK